MKVLVLGGSGFLGSTIYKKLLRQANVQVIGTCFNNAEYKDLYKLDVLNTDEVFRLFRTHTFDAVVWSLVDIKNEMTLSKDGLSNVLSQIIDNTRFIYVSTTISTGSMQDEDVVPQKRVEGMYNANYVNGKILGESMVATHANQVIVRPGSIYGVDGFGRLDKRTKTIKAHIKAEKNYYRTANMYTALSM